MGLSADEDVSGQPIDNEGAVVNSLDLAPVDSCQKASAKAKFEDRL